MLHDLPLDFFWLGVVLERASQTARILDVHHHRVSQRAADGVGAQAVDDAVWLALLRACSGLEAFMQRFRPGDRRGRRALPGARAAHPRAIRFCVQERAGALRRIRPPDASVSLPGASARSAARLAALHERLSVDGPIEDLHGLLTHVVDEVARIAIEIGGELLGQEVQASQSLADRE